MDLFASHGDQAGDQDPIAPSDVQSTAAKPDGRIVRAGRTDKKRIEQAVQTRREAKKKDPPRQDPEKLEALAPARACFWCKKNEFWQSTVPGLEDQSFCLACRPDFRSRPEGRIVITYLQALGYGGMPRFTFERLLPTIEEEKAELSKPVAVNSPSWFKRPPGRRTSNSSARPHC